MKIPNAANAYIDRQKLTAYSLNPEHPYGAHKAKVFAAALGITIEHADMLYDKLMEIIQSEEASLGTLDDNGQRYEIDLEMTGLNGKKAFVRSAWNVRPDEDFPRLVTVYVL